MTTTSVYADGNGNITVNGVTMTVQQYMAQGGIGGMGGAAQPDQSVIDGKAMLQQFLTSMDLSGIDINTAWQQYVSSGSNLDYWANTWLPTTQAFKTAYPAYQQLMQEGRGLTVTQYRDYKNTMADEAHSAGFPTGTVNNDVITSWLLGGVSAAEGQQRILDAGKAVNQLDTNSQAYLQARELGITDGDLAAYFFHPENALPAIENKLAAAQIGGAAANAGIGLDTSLADQLVKNGVSQSQAQAGFGSIAANQQLFNPLPGQNGQTFNQAQQVGATFGTNPSAAQQLQQIAAQRKATFSAGGSYSTTNQGVVGAGRAQGA